MRPIEYSPHWKAATILADEIEGRDSILAQLTEIASLWNEEFLAPKTGCTSYLPSACRTMCRTGWLTIAIRRLQNDLISNRVHWEDMGVPVARMLPLIPQLQPFPVYSPTPYGRLDEKKAQDMSVEQVSTFLSQVQLDRELALSTYQRFVKIIKILSHQWSDDVEGNVTSNLLYLAEISEPSMRDHLDSWMIWLYAMDVRYAITGRKRYSVTEVDVADKSGRAYASVRQHKMNFDLKYWQFKKALEAVKAQYKSA